MYGGALSVAPHQVPDEGHWQEGRNRRVLRAGAVSHLGELGTGHRRKAHAALEPRRLGRENHRQRRARAADAVWIEAGNKHQEAARDVKVERRLSADGSRAPLEHHGDGGREGNDCRRREIQALVHHEGHDHRVGRDARGVLDA